VPERLRFFLDEHVHPGIAEGLRRRGLDVATCQETGMRSKADEEILRFCREQGYVLMTHDADFLSLHAAGHQHGGIAYCAHGSRSVGEIIRALTILADVVDSAEMTNHLEFL
jgi:predicted nuclease of predicted toxin-antitoxin system